MSTAVDLDLLADYVGGALEGTPDEQRVARLIAADPTWAQAHADLVAADAGIRRWLAAAPTAGPMPAEVGARIEAALLGADAGPVAPGQRTDASRRPSRSHPIDRSDQSRPGGARRRWLAAVTAVAAVVFGIAALGQFLPTMRGQVGSTNADSAGGEAAPQIGLNGVDDADRLAPTNYTPLTLPISGAIRDFTSGKGAIAEDTAKPSVPTPVPGSSRASVVPPSLGGLTDGATLSACFDALRAATDPLGSSLHLYDLGLFEGRPAAIIQLVVGGLITRVYVVGPLCGRGTADLIYTRGVG